MYMLSTTHVYLMQIIKTNSAKDNPLYGSFTVEELLEAFAEFVSSSFKKITFYHYNCYDQEFDDVCLGHLFTYRDFQGIYHKHIQ